MRKLGQGSAATVLIVEDDPELSELLQHFMRGHSYSTYAADTGRQALDVVAQADIDVLLTDIHMPEMNGIEVVSTLRGRGFNRPILVLTSDSSPATRSKALAAGADGFLWKPVDFDLLGDWLEKTQTRMSA